MATILSIIALCISFISMMVAGINAYYSFFYTRRSILLTVAPEIPASRIGTVQPDSQFSLSPILSNSGNKTEVVLSVQIAINHAMPQHQRRQTRGTSTGPFILKSGDSITTGISVGFDKMLPFPNKQDVVIRVVALSPRNNIVAVDVPVCHMAIRKKENTGEEYFSETRHSKHDAESIDILSYEKSAFGHTDTAVSATQAQITIEVLPQERVQS